VAVKKGHVLLHQHARACPDGPRSMMSEAHRACCANGRQCRTPSKTGHSPRAVFYARTPDRAFYLCEACAMVFAHIHQLPFEVCDAPEVRRG